MPIASSLSTFGTVESVFKVSDAFNAFGGSFMNSFSHHLTLALI